MEIGQRDPPLAANDVAAFETTGGDACLTAGKVQDIVAKRGSGQRHRLASDDRAGADEGAGIVGRQVGVGIDGQLQ